MGIVCSCLASTFMWTGELLENLVLAIGEIGSILIRGIFALLVGLCDLLASISCCCQVPYHNRPDRTSYDFVTTHKNVGRGGVFVSYMTKEGRAARKQVAEANKKERQLRSEAAAAKKEEEKKQKAKWAQEKKEAAEKAKAAAAAAKKAEKEKK